MPKQFFENTGKSPRQFYGVTLQPGEQKWIEVPGPSALPPPTYPVTQDPVSKKFYGPAGDELPLVSGVGNLILDGASAGQKSPWTPFEPGQRIAYALDSGSTATTASVDFSFDGATSAGQAFTISYASSTVFEIGTLLVSAYFVALALAAKRAGTFKGYFFRVTVLTGGPLSVYANI